MRISELAKMYNMSSKDLLVEIETFRSELEGKGLFLPGSPKPSNRLEDDTTREVLAIFDRRQNALKVAKEEQDREEEQKKQDEELRKTQEKLEQEKISLQKEQEAARVRADEELKRKQEEMAAAALKDTGAVAVAPPSPTPVPAIPPPPPVVQRARPRSDDRPRPQDNRPRPQDNRPRQQDDRPRPQDDRSGRPKREKPKEKSDKPQKLILPTISVMKDEFEGGRARGRRRDRGERDDSESVRRRRPIKGAEPDRGAGKRFRPSRLFSVDDVPNRPAGPGGARKPRVMGDDRRRPHAPPSPPKPIEPKIVQFTGDFTLSEFADRTGISTVDLMRQLLMMGEAVTINQILDPDLAELLASENNISIHIVREGDDLDIAAYLEKEDAAALSPRPPVVTVMGHVDHGKTTLLDAIRQTNVVDSEHGGITQHIGAYTVGTDKGPITFLDTPGHEAFTAMRARGANMTDIVILVVAANDGIMPQTVEAINHARAAHVPIVVAINKIDVPGANLLRVKQELMKYELVPEELGGSTIVAEVSAKTQMNIQELLEMVVLQSEIQELKGNPNRPAVGAVVESHVDPQRGVLATILVQNGTLHTGDVILAASSFGRVRAMMDDKGNPLEEAGPSTPVVVLGLSVPPPAGETFVVTEDEMKAREIAEARSARRRRRGLAQRSAVTLESLSQHIEDGKVKDLNLILKADVQGSLEAISNAIQKLPSTKVRPAIIHSGIGAINVSDVDLATASGAVIIGFNVTTDPQAADLAEQNQIQINRYRVIYDLLDELRRAMLGLLDKKFQEVDQAKAIVLQVFRSSKFGTVAGCRVESGTLLRTHKARVVRNGEVLHKSEISSLRRVKEDVKQVPAGTECGIGVEGFSDVKEGDQIQTFILEELAPEL